MMGPTKLGTMREEIRRALNMSDTELLVWFQRQMDEAGQKRKVNPVVLDTLRLLRDALVTEAKRRTARGRRPRKVTRARSTGR